jgi:hypothetical protein
LEKTYYTEIGREYMEKYVYRKATEIGKKLYINYGFYELKNEMEIQIGM